MYLTASLYGIRCGGDCTGRYAADSIFFFFFTADCLYGGGFRRFERTNERTNERSIRFGSDSADSADSDDSDDSDEAIRNERTKTEDVWIWCGVWILEMA